MADIDAMRLDQSVTRPEQDRYGFRHVATQLAQSVQAIGREGDAVIGIEGACGLLNLLRTELDKKKEDNSFVLSISPWLDGSGTSLVESLLIPVAGSIATEEKNRLSPEERTRLEKKKTVTRTARILMEYTRATARHLAPLAQTVAMIPGLPDTSNALSALISMVAKSCMLVTRYLRIGFANNSEVLQQGLARTNNRECVLCSSKCTRWTLFLTGFLAVIPRRF